MFCEKCGNETSDVSKTCPNCGANLHPPALPGMESEITPPPFSSPPPLPPLPSAAPVQSAGFASSWNASPGPGSETAKPNSGVYHQGQAGHAGQGGYGAPPPPPYAANPYGAPPYGQPMHPAYGIGTEPLTVWGFMWTMLVGAIPFIGWIIFLVWAFGGSKNINRRNYARAWLLWVIIGIALTICITVILGLSGALLSSMHHR